MDAGALRESTTAELVDVIDQLDALMTATHAQLLQVVAEYDRREAWREGGPTDPDNLVSLCRYHHRLVHEGGWRIEGDPGDVLRFVHPQGRELSTRPVPIRREVQERLLPA